MLWIKHGKIWQCVPDTHLQNTEPSSSVPHGVGKRWSYIYTTMQRRWSQNIPMIHLGYWVRNRRRLLFCRWHFKCIFLNGKYFSLIQISLKCVAKSPIDNKAELVQVIFDAKKSPSHSLSELILSKIHDTIRRGDMISWITDTMALFWYKEVKLSVLPEQECHYKDETIMTILSL